MLNEETNLYKRRALEAAKTTLEKLDQLTRQYAAIAAKLEQLKAAGTYSTMPTEQWQTRGGVGKYLYHVWTLDRRTRKYQGPNGIRKLYIGADPARIENARARAARTAQAITLHRYQDSTAAAILALVRDLQAAATRTVPTIAQDHLTLDDNGRAAVSNDPQPAQTQTGRPRPN